MLHAALHETRKATLASIALPIPNITGGQALGETLRRRQTIRDIAAKPLPTQTLSNLLWAACGVNRKRGPFDAPGITAASASNSQEVDLFVAMKSGVYLFDAAAHQLIAIASDDLRPMAISRGQRRVMPDAPVQLIYVADIDKLAHTRGFEEPGLHDPEVQKSYYYVDTGIIAANVYLFAASQGLAAWFHNCDRAGLAQKLKLRPEQRVLFAQTVGYPKGESL